MVRKTLPKRFGHVTLDDDYEQNLARSNADAFLNAHPWPLFIDEIQKAPNLFDAIKKRIDKQKFESMEKDGKCPLMYVLSGSNQFELRNKAYDSRTGRIYPLHLFSLSYPEKMQAPTKRFTPDISTLKEREGSCPLRPLGRKEVFRHIFEGGMPEIVVNKVEREDYWTTYLETYVEKDVRNAILSKNVFVFREFLKLLAMRTGQELNKQSLSSALGISVKTVDEWLGILSLSGIVRFLRPYMANVSNRIIKAPKIYFMDTGFCAWLCGWTDSEMLERSALSGAFYETYVVSEIIKSLEGEGVRSEEVLFYYRDIDQREVDLLYVEDKKIVPIEIKKSVLPTKPTKNFSVLSKYGQEIRPGLVIDTASEMHPINDKAWIYPVHLIGA